MKTRLFLGLSVGLFLCLCAYADVDPESSTAEEAVNVETPATSAVAEEPTTEAVSTPETKKAEEATATENEAPAATAVPEEKTAEETPAAVVTVEEKTVEAVVVPAEPAAEKPVAETEAKASEQVLEEKPAADEKPAPVVEEITVEAVAAPAEPTPEKPSVETETAASDTPVESAPAPVIDKPKKLKEPPKTDTEKNVADTEKSKDSSEEKCMCSKIGRAILFYIPNRILDLNDSFSMDIGAGAEAAAEVGITKYAQLGGSYGSEYFLAKGYNNQYGGGYSSGWSYAIVPPVLDEKRYIDEDDYFGTIKPYIIEKDGPHIESRSAEVYKKQYRDFWAIRASGGWLITAQVEIHPIDLADFVLGFFFVDFKGNDIK